MLRPVILVVVGAYLPLGTVYSCKSPINVDSRSVVPTKLDSLDFVNYDAKLNLNVTFEAGGARIYGFNATSSRPAISGATMEEEHELVEIRLSGHWYDDASPHSLDERHFPVEIQLIHRSGTGKAAVVVVHPSYKQLGTVCVFDGCTRAPLDPLIEALDTANKKRVKTSVGSFKASWLLPSERKYYYAYDGSVPGDCSTSARYYIFTEQLELPQERIRKLRSAISSGDGSKPEQFSAGRVLRRCCA